MTNAINLKAWADFISKIRKFFDEREFIEIFTPQLVAAGAFESCLDSLSVTYAGGRAELNTSPEIEMKWVIAQTGASVYQICKSYRDDPLTPTHGREFTMLEFYGVGADYRAMKTLVRALVQFLSPDVGEFCEVTVRDIVREKTAVDLAAAPDAPALRAAIERHGVLALSADDSWDDMFLKLLIEKVEPALDPEVPTFLVDYPPSMAALAAIDPQRGLAQRFELYWRRIELANGCTELRDVAELSLRYERECAARRARGKAPHPYPTRLFAAVEKLPPCAGVAIGLDRLFMALRRSESIHRG